jgi:signal transduction histidine kinase
VLQRRRVEVELVGEAVPLVIGDRDALHRVFVNVILNAAESISSGGCILVHAYTEQASIASLPSVAIDIADSGTGIPAPLISRVFERGVTTKNSGSESGLGLASAKRSSRRTAAGSSCPAARERARSCTCPCRGGTA